MSERFSPGRTVARVLLPASIGVALALLLTRTAVDATLRARLADANPIAVAAMLLMTVAWVGLRFLRWQFLLRRAHIRVPIRPALVSYLAALPGIATPSAIGEVLRAVLLRRRFQVPVAQSVVVLVIERLYDVLAIALLLALAGHSDHLQLAGLSALSAMLLIGVLIALLGLAGFAPQAATGLRSPYAVLVSLGSSVLIWGCAASVTVLAGVALQQTSALRDSLDVMAWSTLVGGASLAPAGIGTIGAAAMTQLASIGVAAGDAGAVVALVQLVALGSAFAAGAVFLLREWHTRPGVIAETEKHFDVIAHEYNAQWSPHVWDLLLDRKLSIMIRALEAERYRTGTGLDLGCGLGIQTTEMRRRGFNVIGLEPSVGLLRQRRAKDLPVVAGDALALPLPDASIDFAYMIGVLHHVPGREAQAQALRELARVLKPGGLLLIHESNPRNPLFRFYMGYLFPLLKSIDEGTEWWVDPRTWAARDQFTVADVQYFTFLPDFTPRALMGPALAIERWLERGATRTYSAHYMAVVQRNAPSGANTAP
ncbi:MAG: flippase-like domain-containing protein [Gemmatimonadaceae bacterium]|nr:flippase-like domain-containing protein [Gemmatimonadaceae bacterium]